MRPAYAGKSVADAALAPVQLCGHEVASTTPPRVVTNNGGQGDQQCAEIAVRGQSRRPSFLEACHPQRASMSNGSLRLGCRIRCSRAGFGRFLFLI